MEKALVKYLVQITVIGIPGVYDQHERLAPDFGDDYALHIIMTEDTIWSPVYRVLDVSLTPIQ